MPNTSSVRSLKAQAKERQALACRTMDTVFERVMMEALTQELKTRPVRIRGHTSRLNGNVIDIGNARCGLHHLTKRVKNRRYASVSASVTLSRLNEQKYKIFLIEVPDYDSVWYVIPTQKLKERFFRPTDDSKKSVTLYFALERTPRPGSQMDFGAFKDAWHLLK